MKFAESQGEELGHLHGCFLSYGFQDPVQGGVFLVGDAAGQCLPLTGEGIRPAVYFGQRCGDIIQAILEGRMSMRQGLDEYRRLVERLRPLYVALQRLQRRIGLVPAPGLIFLGWLAAHSPLGHRIIANYLRDLPTVPGHTVAQPSLGALP